MRTFKTFVLGAVAALAMGTSAFATDLYVETTPMVSDEGTDWSGFYVGVLKGFSYAWESDCQDCNESFFDISKVFGYNWDQGNVIYGIDKMVTFTFLPEEQSAFKLAIQKMARIGVEVGDRSMIYAGAGLGWAGIINCDCGPIPQTFYGAAAVGFEMKVSDELNWRTHVQYSKPLDPSLSWLNVVSAGTGLVWTFN